MVSLMQPRMQLQSKHNLINVTVQSKCEVVHPTPPTLDSNVCIYWARCFVRNEGKQQAQATKSQVCYQNVRKVKMEVRTETGGGDCCAQKFSVVLKERPLWWHARRTNCSRCFALSWWPYFVYHSKKYKESKYLKISFHHVGLQSLPKSSYVNMKITSPNFTHDHRPRQPGPCPLCHTEDSDLKGRSHKNFALRRFNWGWRWWREWDTSPESRDALGKGEAFHPCMSWLSLMREFHAEICVLCPSPLDRRVWLVQQHIYWAGHHRGWWNLTREGLSEPWIWRRVLARSSKWY